MAGARRWASGVTIGYGSATGTGMTFAAMFAKDVQNLGLDVALMDANDVDEEVLGGITADNPLVLVMATCGEGEPTPNAKEFHTKLVGDELVVPKSAPFAVFGLGNSAAYKERFNVAARTVHAKLVEQGGTPLLPLGLGDDAGTIPGHWIDDDFDDWAEQLIAVLKTEGGGEGSGSDGGKGGGGGGGGGEKIKVHGPGDQGAIKAREELERKRGEALAQPGAKADHTVPGSAVVVGNTELHGPESTRSARRIVLTPGMEGDALAYETGDHLAVFPENDPADVALLMDALDLDPDALISVEGGESELDARSARLVYGDLVDAPLPLESILRTRKDVSAPPSGSTLSKLGELMSPADAAALSSAFSTPSGGGGSPVFFPSLAEAVAGAPSLRGKIGVGGLLSLVPPLKSRFYSISSAAEEDGQSIELTVSVVPKGLASNYLARRGVGSRVSCFVRDSNFRLPADPLTPIIMVGAGAGIAPLRGFVRARRMAAERGEALGEAHLFFGCEAPGVDDLYADEMAAAVADGVLTKVWTAYNQHPTAEGDRYAQHLLARVPEVVERTLGEGGVVYVCGKESTLGEGCKEVVEGVLGWDRMQDVLERGEQLVQDVFS